MRDGPVLAATPQLVLRQAGDPRRCGNPLIRLQYDSHSSASNTYKSPRGISSTGAENRNSIPQTTYHTRKLPFLMMVSNAVTIAIFNDGFLMQFLNTIFNVGFSMRFLMMVFNVSFLISIHGHGLAYA